MGCARWPKGRDTEGDVLLGFRSTHRPRAVRPVLLPERSQSWRVKSLRACVIPAAQASSGGGGVGGGRGGAVCVKREERAWDAGGKEGEWGWKGWRQQK